MLHYNFPRFQLARSCLLRGAGRREIGTEPWRSGAISAVLPSETTGLTRCGVSDILESNGSQSMATVCGASLSLMDAGVATVSPVAGVAWIGERGDQYAILTDIAGAEDHYGDMDFKVAGTREGITAAADWTSRFPGITANIMREAMDQAHKGRPLHPDKMNAALAEPRTKVSAYAPRFLYPANSYR